MKREEVILLAHGGGGAKTKALISDIVLKHLRNPILDRLDDSACLTVPDRELAFTTDSYVVQPIFFPGGDIGRLAACGTINDLAMQGAEPRFMSLGLILEEGLAISDLDRVVRSIRDVVEEAGVLVVTGDTKVIERTRAGGGILINTSGIGVRLRGTDVHVSNGRPGDEVILTGTMGDHGVAVMSMREGLKFESELVSDVAPLWGMVGDLLKQVPAVRCLRDPTRGGVAAALCDIAERSSVSIRVRESALPVKNEVRGACALLGLDPMNVANEGKAIVVCDPGDSALVLQTLRSHPLGREARAIGRLDADPKGMVLLQTVIGGERIVELPSGEDLPRIC